MHVYRLLHVEDEPDIREVVEMSLALDPEIILKSCASGASRSWLPPTGSPTSS